MAITISAQIVAAYVVTVTSGIILEIPRHVKYYVGFIGAAGYAVYLFSLPYTSKGLAALCGSLVIASLSQVAARIFKTPVTIFYIPSYFPIVPGASVYKIAYYYIQGNTQMAGHNFFESMIISGAIALSVYLVDSFIEIYNHFKQLSL
ncbi:threonine/serine exporter family protein [Streptococcus halichoeri]|uniref:threonine/serine exporter family protein n=1 Tax=Streptococcus halichoeri TaxID=254785 RepID=UPI0038B55405